MARQRLPEAFALARRALERNPDAGYFYYIISLTPDSAKGLRSAKVCLFCYFAISLGHSRRLLTPSTSSVQRGMKCKMYTTPFVKQALKHRAVDYAVDLSVGAFARSAPGDKTWKEGIGFLRSAFEDASSYIAEAPPDQRQMKTVINWYIILTLVIRGPEIDADLTQLQVS